MPIDVKFDEDRELLHITLSDTWPTLPEIVAERSRLILAGYLRAGIVELVDARNVTRGLPNLSQMKAILQAISSLPIKRAVLVSSNIQFAAGRLAETLDPHGVRVFREESVAIEWLFHNRRGERVVKVTPAKSS
jgi:hypothetical protein